MEYGHSLLVPHVNSCFPQVTIIETFRFEYADYVFENDIAKKKVGKRSSPAHLVTTCCYLRILKYCNIYKCFEIRRSLLKKQFYLVWRQPC